MARRALALTGLLALPLLCVSPAAASCAAPVEPVRLADHDLVFAGEVLDTEDDGRLAEVRVLDLWRGRDLPPEVVVVGGGANGGGFSSVDRVFVNGQTYAFFPYENEEGVLLDNACTATAPLSRRVALDPLGVRPPRADAPAPADPRTPTWMWLTGGAAVLATGVLAAALRSRRRGRLSAGPAQAL